MSGVSTCLKRTFTVFNIFFAVIGALMVGLAWAHPVLTNINAADNVRTGTYALYIVGIVTMVTASLGAYGAHKESKLCLSLFLGCMVTGMLLMLTYGIPVAVSCREVRNVIESDMRYFVPLREAPEDTKSMMDTIQTQGHCCGLFSYTDWEDDIPESCKCSPTEDDDKCQMVGYGLVFPPSNVFVYSKTCLPLVVDSFQLVVDVVISILFALAALALLGAILSSVMIHQMRCPAAPAVRMPPIFMLPPPKYELLHKDPPAYC